jgi:hypothetical protein
VEALTQDDACFAFQQTALGACYGLSMIVGALLQQPCLLWWYGQVAWWDRDLQDA